jgi:hypothetical protein
MEAPMSGVEKNSEACSQPDEQQMAATINVSETGGKIKITG